MNAGNFSFGMTIPKRICIPGEHVVMVKINPMFFSTLPAPSAATTYELWEIVLKIVFYVVAFILDIIGNFIVILIIGLNRKMRTTTNMLILNLAVSDLLVGVFCMWIHMGNHITSEWPFGEFVCKFNTFVQVVVMTSSVLTLSVISVERFLAILFPLKTRWSPFTTAIIVLVTWCVSAAVACPHLIVRHVSEYQWRNRKEISCDEMWPSVYKDSACNTFQPIQMAYYVVGGVVMYFIPIVVMMSAYAIIAIRLITRKPPGCLISSTTNIQDRTKRKVIRMLVVVMCVFVLCWTPQQVLLLWHIFKTSEKAAQYMSSVKYAALYIAFLNSAINPVLYGCFNENFRKGFSTTFQRIFKSNNRVAPAETTAVRRTNTIHAVTESVSRRQLEPRREAFITNNTIYIPDM